MVGVRALKTSGNQYIPAIMLGLFSIALAQAQERPSRLTFDVASIRLSQPGQKSGSIKPLPGGNGYAAQNISLKLMISLMYKVPMRQITAGPEWINTDGYDVEARADQAYGIDDLHTMFQNLLTDRFSLRFHKEAREGPVYALTVDKSGLKMKADGSGQDLKIPITFGKNGESVGVRVPMQYLCWWLGMQLQDARPVVDKTRLTNSYDFTLRFAPELPPEISREDLGQELSDRPSIFDALRDQLGLRLSPEKGPVDYYVIDHVERPSEN